MANDDQIRFFLVLSSLTSVRLSIDRFPPKVCVPTSLFTFLIGLGFGTPASQHSTSSTLHSKLETQLNFDLWSSTTHHLHQGNLINFRQLALTTGVNNAGGTGPRMAYAGMPCPDSIKS